MRLAVGIRAAVVAVVGPLFGLIVHHTDADREWAYDRSSHIGKLHEGPDAGSTVVDMKAEWKVIDPFRK